MQPPSSNQFTNGYVDREIYLDDRAFRLRVPDDPDQVLEQAADDGGHDPYWSVLWAAARPTAEHVLRYRWQGHKTAIELGCGMGLTGLAALSRGLHVTFTDVVPTAVQLSLHNAHQNDLPRCDGIVMDWDEFHQQSDGCGPFDAVLASDVLYDRRYHSSLLSLITRLLQPAGVCLIGDPRRRAADQFIAKAENQGWSVQVTDQQTQNFRCLQLQWAG